jgi:hypothetical protein
MRRLAPLALVGVLAIGTAAGAAPRAPAATPAGFVPEATPIRVRAPDVRITDLAAVARNRPIDLAGGKRSPDGTLMLRFARIELDNVSLRQTRAAFGLAITDGGTGDKAASIGGAGGTVELWGVLRNLRICLSAGCTDVRPLLPVLPSLIATGRLPREIRGEDLDIDIYALRAKARPGEFGLRLPGGRVQVTSK